MRLLGTLFFLLPFLFFTGEHHASDITSHASYVSHHASCITNYASSTDNLFTITYIVDVNEADLALRKSQTNVWDTFGAENREAGGQAVSPTDNLFDITYIVDGDTFDGVNASGEKIRFRPIGLDTPETGWRDGNPEPFHAEATAYTTQLLKGKQVRIEYDVDSKDRWNRHLVYVWLKDGTFYNEEIIRAGWAVVATYPPNVKYVKQFTAAQREAREQGRGMWAPEH